MLDAFLAAHTLTFTNQKQLYAPLTLSLRHLTPYNGQFSKGDPENMSFVKKIQIWFIHAMFILG
jgi:hypothetical protein